MIGARPLTEPELARVVACVGGKYAKRDRAMILLGCRTGFRVSELLWLRVRDVADNGRIRDEVRVPRRAMKGSKEGRAIWLNLGMDQPLVELIDFWKECGYWLPSNFLFRSRQGDNEPIKVPRAYQILRAAFVRAGLNGRYSTHTMRKTFAWRAIEYLRDTWRPGRPAPETALQQVMGHRDLASTMHYISDFDSSWQREAVMAAGRDKCSNF